MSSLIPLVVVDQEPRVDSRLIAEQLGVDHQNTRELIDQYQTDFEEFGIIRFETGKIQGRGRPEKFALLNEDQSYLLLTYAKNTEQARTLKKRLVRSFGDCRRTLADTPPALPKPRIIRTRDDLSFTRRDAEGRLQFWVVPYDPQGDWHTAVLVGRSYFAEVVELAKHNLEEAQRAVSTALGQKWEAAPGSNSQWHPGGCGFQIGFAEALAEALFPGPEKPLIPASRKQGDSHHA